MEATLLLENKEYRHTVLNNHNLAKLRILPDTKVINNNVSETLCMYYSETKSPWPCILQNKSGCPCARFSV